MTTPVVKDKDYHKALVESLAEAHAEVERLRSALQEMPDVIKDFDGGNPETATGWASEEMLDLWIRVCAALEPKP